MRDGTAVPVAAGLTAGVAFVVLFASFSSLLPVKHIADSGVSVSSEIPLSEDNNPCGEPLKSVISKAPFSILIPKALPEGYSLQSVDYTPSINVYMQYFTKSVCDPNNPVTPEEGIIEIVEGSLSQISDAKTGQEYIDREMSSFKANGLKSASYVFQDGRMHAAGYEAGVGISRAIDENGNIIHQDQSSYPAQLLLADEKTGTLVKIQARSTDISLDSLAKIAESMEEKV